MHLPSFCLSLVFSATILGAIPSSTDRTHFPTPCLNGGWHNSIRLEMDRESGQSYVVRTQKERVDSIKFSRMVEAALIAADSDTGPRVFKVDEESQTLWMDYIPSRSWENDAVSPLACHEALRQLRRFHSYSRDTACHWYTDICIPYTDIFSRAQAMEDRCALPHQFKLAIDRLGSMLMESHEWLEVHSCLCHGDFHRGNALITGSLKSPEVLLIDFDDADWGHPYADVIKFLLPLERSRWPELFASYLGKQSGEPMLDEDLEQFHNMYLATLLIVATHRLEYAFERAKDGGEEILGKAEMEGFLDDLMLQEHPPSFLDIPYDDDTPQARQRGALYALHEFLVRSELSSLKR